MDTKDTPEVDAPLRSGAHRALARASVAILGWQDAGTATVTVLAF